MAVNITGNTELANTKNDLIISLVQKELMFNAKLLPFATDYSAFAGKGVKSISVPKLASFTVQNRASETEGDIMALSTAKDQINLSFNAYVSWLIDSADEVESSIDAQIEFAKRAAAAHGRYVDTQLIAALEAGAGLDVGAAPITRDLFLDMREYLLGNEADPSQMVFVAGVDQEKALLKITEFSQAQVFGNPVIPSGQIGSIYGVPVVIHSGIAAGKAYMWDKAGLAVAFQKQPSMAEQPEVGWGTTAKRVAIDQKFGVAVLQQGEKGAGAGLSPLVVKL